MVFLSKYSVLLATCFGVGSISCISAPGTFSSFLSIFLWWLLNIFLSWKILFFILVFLIVFGCYFCHQANKFLDVHDHKCIVLDEFIGMWCILILSPDITNYNLKLIFCEFLLFRLFDIFKPWPISYIHNNIRNGLGIVLDDIVASVFSIVCIFLLNNLLFSGTV